MGTDPRSALDAWLRRVDDVLAEQAVANDHLHPDLEDDRPPLLPKIWCRFVKESDLVLEVRTGWNFGVEYLQLLDFVPSTGKYEAALLIEGRLLGRLLGKLMALHRYSGGTAASLG